MFPGSILPAVVDSIRETASIHENPLPPGCTNDIHPLVVASNDDINNCKCPPVIASSNDGINKKKNAGRGETVGSAFYKKNRSQNELKQQQQQPQPEKTSNHHGINHPSHGMVKDTTCWHQYCDRFLVQGQPQQHQVQEREMQLHYRHMQQKDHLLWFQQHQRDQLRIQQLQDSLHMMKQQEIPAAAVLDHSQPWHSHPSGALNIMSSNEPSSSCSKNAAIVDIQLSDNPRRTIEGENEAEWCTTTSSQGNDAEGNIGTTCSQSFGGALMAGTKRPHILSTPYAPIDMNESLTSSKRSCKMGRTIKEYYPNHITAPSSRAAATCTASFRPCHQQEQKQYENGFKSSIPNNSFWNTTYSFSKNSRPRVVSPQEKENHVNEVLQQKALKDHEKSNNPRRPLTAYNFYFSEERERVLSQIPEPTNGEEVTEFGAFSPRSFDTSSEIFQETLSKLKETMANAPKLNRKEQDALDELVRMKTKSTLDAHTDRDRKKRNHRKDHGKVSFCLLSSVIGEHWKSLPRSEKAYYNRLAKQDLDRYHEGMVVYGRQRKKIRDQFL